MNWADFLNVDSDVMILVRLISNSLTLDAWGPLQLYFLFLVKFSMFVGIACIDLTLFRNSTYWTSSSARRSYESSSAFRPPVHPPVLILSFQDLLFFSIFYMS